MNPVSLIRAGSDKRIVFLSLPQSSWYMRNQILDIMHDASMERITEEYVIAISALYAHWIVAVNRLDAKYERKIVDEIARQFGLAGFFGKEVNKVASSIIESTTKDRATVSLKRIINDNCSSQASPRSILALSKTELLADAREVATFSTIYDSGSSTNTCGSDGDFISVESNIPRAIWTTQHAELRAVLSAYPRCDPLRQIRDDDKMFTSARIVVCVGRDSAAGSLAISAPRDLGVVGSIDELDRPIVLAYRGVCTERAPGPGERLVCRYTHFHDSARNISSRGGSQSRGITRAIISSWITLMRRIPSQHPCDIASAASDETLRIYAELAAKHWGDLGLVIDAAHQSDTFMITADQMAQVLCLQFGAYSAQCQQGHMILADSDVLSAYPTSTVRIVDFANTGDIFADLSAIYPSAFATHIARPSFR